MCYLRGRGEGVEADIVRLWGTGAEEGGGGGGGCLA